MNSGDRSGLAPSEFALGLKRHTWTTASKRLEPLETASVYLLTCHWPDEQRRLPSHPPTISLMTTSSVVETATIAQKYQRPRINCRTVLFRNSRKKTPRRDVRARSVGGWWAESPLSIWDSAPRIHTGASYSLLFDKLLRRCFPSSSGPTSLHVGQASFTVKLPGHSDRHACPEEGGLNCDPPAFTAGEHEPSNCLGFTSYIIKHPRRCQRPPARSILLNFRGAPQLGRLGLPRAYPYQGSSKPWIQPASLLLQAPQPPS